MSLSVRYLNVSEAEARATVKCDHLQAFSESATMGMGANDVPWATLEPGVWLLDGTRKILPDDPVEIGWWSNGAFGTGGASSAVLGQAVLGQMVLGQEGAVGIEDTPCITITYPVRRTASGITIVFSPSTDQWCTEILVSWYRGGSFVASAKDHPTSARWYIGYIVEDFDKITVELLSVNKTGHMAKVQQIHIGGEAIIFERDELIRTRLVNEVDPSFGSLTVDTMHVEIKDKNGRNLVPKKNQKMELYRDGKLIAAQYIKDYSRETADIYTFSCQSAIGLLEDEYLGGMYDGMPIDAVLTSILDGHEYEIADAFKAATVSGYIPVCTRRVALQHVALALGAMVTTQGGAAIRLIPLPTSAAQSFGKSELFSGSKITGAPRVARCEVVAHSYSKSTEEETLLSEEPVSGTDVLITFDAPHYAYAIIGGEIVDSDVNWIRVTTAGAVTVTAKTFTHVQTVYSRENPAATYAERNNVLSISTATLIGSGNVKSVLNKLYASSLRRQTLKQEAVIGTHRAGEMVSSISPWGTEFKGILTQMDSELTQNGHTASITILGDESGSSAYRFAGEIYSNDEEVLY